MRGGGGSTGGCVFLPGSLMVYLTSIPFFHALCIV
jgi:hypothetical protein